MDAEMTKCGIKFTLVNLAWKSVTADQCSDLGTSLKRCNT